MPYVIPITDGEDGNTSVDGKTIPHSQTVIMPVVISTPVQASAAGFGVLDPHTGYFEVLDALPLKRQSVQNSIQRSSSVNFTIVDYLTGDEIRASQYLDSELLI